MSIQTRLILALSSLALALVLGIVLLFQWRFDLGMVDYVNAQQQARLEWLAEELAERWDEDPGWEQLRADPKAFFRLARRGPDRHAAREPVLQGAEGFPGEPPHGEGPPHPPHGPHRPPAGPPLPPPLPVLLLDREGQVLIARGKPPATLPLKIPVRVDGDTVGYVASPRVAELENDVDRHFREAQLRSLWAVSALALLVAVAFAVALARHFTRPLRQLSAAAHRLNQQQYAIEVDDARRDELGALGRDMRELAATLARHADARARWFADISHELRTPLSVLAGEIDALLDGIRPLTRERIVSLQQEVQHLRRLVDDLYVLARADLGALQYRKQDVDLGALLRERLGAAQSSIEQAGLTLALQAPDATVYGDADRLRQLIDNLVSNSLRYTGRGGRLQASVSVQNDDVQLVIEDSAPGVPDDALPRLFDHLFRVDDARTRGAGGAGLGLAICQRIVEAHGGTIRASHSALGGLRMQVTLPRAPAGGGSSA